MKIVKHKTPYLIMRIYDDISLRANAMVIKIDESTVTYLKRYDVAAKAARDKIGGEFCSLEIEEFPFAYFMNVDTEGDVLFHDWYEIDDSEKLYLEVTEDEFDKLWEKYESEYYFRNTIRFYGNEHFSISMILPEDDLIAQIYLPSGMIKIKDVEQ